VVTRTKGYQTRRDGTTRDVDDETKQMSWQKAEAEGRVGRVGARVVCGDMIYPSAESSRPRRQHRVPRPSSDRVRPAPRRRRELSGSAQQAVQIPSRGRCCNTGYRIQAVEVICRARESFAIESSCTAPARLSLPAFASWQMQLTRRITIPRGTDRQQSKQLRVPIALASRRAGPHMGKATARHGCMEADAQSVISGQRGLVRIKTLGITDDSRTDVGYAALGHAISTLRCHQRPAPDARR
jgi:hypothetical protein